MKPLPVSLPRASLPLGAALLSLCLLQPALRAEPRSTKAVVKWGARANAAATKIQRITILAGNRRYALASLGRHAMGR